MPPAIMQEIFGGREYPRTILTAGAIASNLSRFFFTIKPVDRKESAENSEDEASQPEQSCGKAWSQQKLSRQV
jgi:hypothetical protein